METDEEPKNLYDIASLHPNFIREHGDYVYEKSIGRGGFSEVWSAHDIKTDIKVAMKELTTTVLTGNALKRYVREIHCMARANNRFILPLSGFTVDPPYCIITEYLSNGSLHQRIYRNKVNPTHFTIIAMCVANGMAHLHSMNIIHRDLKPANILLDNKLYPRIIDFGLARELKVKSHMTKSCGTVLYMAPEILSGGRYSEKIDVYAFGMMLYEMCEMKHPYENISPSELAAAVIETDLRPKFSKNTPHAFKKLIEKCWDRDPEVRPSFASIYNDFASGSIAFPSTDGKKVAKTVMKIAEDERRRASSLTELPPMRVDLKRIQNKLKNKQTDQPKPPKSHKHETPPHTPPPPAQEERAEVIPKPILNPIFPNPFQSSRKFEFTTISDSERERLIGIEKTDFVNNTERSNYLSLAVYLQGFLAKMSSPEEISNVLAKIMNLMEKDHYFIETAFEAGIFSVTPFISPQIINQCMDMMSMLLIHRATLVDERITPPMNFYIAYAPLDALKLFAIYVERFSLLGQNCFLVDYFISHAGTYSKTEHVSKYLGIFVSLIYSSQAFYRTYMPYLRPVFTALHQTTVPVNAIAANNAIALTYDYYFQVDFEAILYHLQLFETRASALSVLKKVFELPKSKRLLNVLITLSKDSMLCNLILLKFASEGIEKAQLFLENEEWMTMELPTILDTFKITILIYTYPELRAQFSRLKSFPDHLTMALRSNNVYVYHSIRSIIRRSQLTMPIVVILQSKGFIKAYLEIAARSDDETILNSAIVCLDALARTGPSEDYVVLFDKMYQMLVNHSPMSQLILNTLVTLSKYKECLCEMANLGLIQLFQNIKDGDDSEMKAYAEEVVRNAKIYM